MFKFISLTVFLIMISCSSLFADETRPISPCRVLDTRNNSTGYLSAGATLSFKVRDYYVNNVKVHPGSVQGGDSNCGIPTSATAIQLSIAAVSPSATGHVVIWPYGQSQPATSSLNVSVSETTNNGLFGLIGSGSYDLNLKGVGIAAYYVVDILGYTVPSLESLVGQAVGTQSSHILVVQTVEGQTVLVYSPSYMTDYRSSWVNVIPDAVNNCVEVLGYWTDGNTSGEAGIFEARSLPQVMPGYCGPNM